MSILFNVSPSRGGNFHANDEGAHEQSREELKSHLKALEDEYRAKHPLHTVHGIFEAANRQREAEAWAKKEEPKRYLSYLFNSIDGISADTMPREVNGRTQKATSSWVSGVRRISPNLVEIFTKDGGSYTYGGDAKAVEKFLTSPSMGAELNKANHDQPSSLRALWHAKRGK